MITQIKTDHIIPMFFILIMGLLVGAILLNAPVILLFMLAGGASLMVGLQWYDVYTTSTGLTIGLMLIAYALACLAFAFRYLFWKGTISEE